MILVTPKQEMERKSEWFCGVKLFRSNFKVEWENSLWTKICFLASGFLFTCGNFTLIFKDFFDFLPLFFFRNGFPNSLLVRSRSSFCSVNENSLNCTSGLVLLCFVTSSNKNFSLYISSQLVQHFAWNLFDFSWLVLLDFVTQKIYQAIRMYSIRRCFTSAIFLINDVKKFYSSVEKMNPFLR